jgi:hypothetical protein
MSAPIQRVKLGDGSFIAVPMIEGRPDFSNSYALPSSPSKPRQLAVAAGKLAAKFREFAESRYGWWSDDNSIGQPYTGPYPSNITDQGISILNVDQFGIPQVMTVALNRDFLATNANCDAFARVQYGIGSYSDSFEVDAANGMQFSIAASSLRVSLLPEVRAITLPYATGTSVLQAGAACAKFPCPNALAPTRTIIAFRNALGWGVQFFTAAAAFTAVSPQRLIPPFARSFFIQSLTGIMDPGASIVLSDIGGANDTYSETFNNLAGNRSVPIAGGSYQFRLEQTAYPYAAVQLAYRIVWQLGL